MVGSMFLNTEDKTTFTGISLKPEWYIKPSNLEMCIGNLETCLTFDVNKSFPYHTLSFENSTSMLKELFFK